MRQDTEAFLLLLRQRASGDEDLSAWFARREGMVAGVMDTVLAARGDDAGRIIGGARKDRGMFAQMFLNAGVDPTSALAELEEAGRDVAFKAITRDKLIPKPSPSALKAKGDNPGVAYLKVALHGYITPRPYDDAEARERYVRAAQAVNEVFDTPYTAVAALLNALRLKYFLQVARRHPEAVEVSPQEQEAARNEIRRLRPEFASSSDSYARHTIHRLAIERLKVEAFPSASEVYSETGYSDRLFLFAQNDYDRMRRVWSRSGGSDDERKKRESIAEPLGSRFYNATESRPSDDKSSWYKDFHEAARIEKENTWAWATGTGDAGVAEGDEAAEPLTREEVLSLPDCADMETQQDDPKAAYFYAWAYKNLIPKKSGPTKKAREAYKVALAHFDHLFADRSDLLTLGNLLMTRKGWLNGDKQVLALPVASVPDDVANRASKEARDYANQFERENVHEREKRRREYEREIISEGIGVPIADLFSGYWGVGRGGFRKTNLYYRLAMEAEDIAPLIEERNAVREALRATSPGLFNLLEGEWDDKIKKAFTKDAWKAGWSDVQKLCAALAADAQKGGKGRGGGFTLPDRGVMASRTGPQVPGPHTSESIQQATGLYGIEYGNWMNDADRAAVNVSVAEALHDLAFVLGTPLASVSLGKRLALALGARGSGKHSAHYEPWSKAINMTRTKGAGALAHEWGHALDHWIADTGKRRMVNGSLTAYFGSMLDGAGGMTGVDVSDTERKAVNEAMMRVTDLLLSGKEEYEKARMRLWDSAHPRPKVPVHAEGTNWRAQERTGVRVSEWDGRIAPATPPARRPEWTPGDVEWVEAVYRFAEDTRAWVAERSDLEKRLRTLNPMLKFAQEAGEYWQRNEEMFARAWESYVEDRLKAEARYSGYLARGTGAHPVYPQGEQRTELYGAFTALLDALRPVLRRTAVRPNGRGSRPRPVLRKPR